MGGTQTMRDFNQLPLDSSQCSTGLYNNESWTDVDLETNKYGHSLITEWKELKRDASGSPIIPRGQDRELLEAKLTDGQAWFFKDRVTYTPTTVFIVQGVRIPNPEGSAKSFTQTPCTISICRNGIRYKTMPCDMALYNRFVRIWRDEVEILPKLPVFVYDTPNPFTVEHK